MNKIDIKKNSKLQSKYPEIVRDLRKKILSGQISGGLPGVQQYAGEYNVNFMTVNKAINKLVEEGLLYRIPRKGTYVKRTYRIALINFTQDDALSRPIPSLYIDLVHAVEKALNKQNLTMIFKRHSRDAELSSADFHGEIDGVISVGSSTNPKTIEWLKKISCVKAMGIPDDNAFCPHATYNNKATGILAANYALKNNFLNTCFINDSENNIICKARGLAFENTMKNSRAKVKKLTPPLSSTHEERIAGIMEIAEKIAKRPLLPELIFTGGIWFLPLIYSVFYKNGIIPQKDIAIITCDKDDSVLACLSPSPILIDIKTGKIGEKAVELLMQIINGKKTEKELIQIKPELVFHNMEKLSNDIAI